MVVNMVILLVIAQIILTQLPQECVYSDRPRGVHSKYKHDNIIDSKAKELDG